MREESVAGSNLFIPEPVRQRDQLLVLLVSDGVV